MDNYIITHASPDLDALTGVWLLKKFAPKEFGLKDAPVEFVNTGAPDPEKLEKALAVVDTGRKFDENYHCFDHHQFPGQASNKTCAAKMVYEYLLKFGLEIEYLQPLVDLVFAGDTGRKQADFSRELGLHAIFFGWKNWWVEQNPGQRLPDHIIMAYGFGLLDVLEARLRKQAEAKKELAEKTIYKSEDGLVWAIKHGSLSSGYAAAEEGARIVVFEGEPVKAEEGLSYPVGIMRYGDWQEPHTGELVKLLLESPKDPSSWRTSQLAKLSTIKEELATWFLHPSGFFSGRGTAKAPVYRPVDVDLHFLGILIDVAWKRQSQANHLKNLV